MKSTGMTVGEDKTITVLEVRVLRVGMKELGEQGVSNGSATHRSTRMTRVGLADNVSSKHTDSIDSLLFKSSSHFVELN